MVCTADARTTEPPPETPANVASGSTARNKSLPFDDRIPRTSASRGMIRHLRPVPEWPELCSFRRPFAKFGGIEHSGGTAADSGSLFLGIKVAGLSGPQFDRARDRRTVLCFGSVTAITRA